MIRVKEFSDQHQEPFLSQTTRINALFSDELDLQTLLDFLATTPDYLTDPTQAVLYKTLSPNLEVEILFQVFIA